MKKKYRVLLSILMMITLIALLGDDMLQKAYAADASYSLKDITYNNSIDNVARTQEQLSALLKDEKVSRIVFEAEKADFYDIPKGDYSDKTLVVNASNLEIMNSGIFKQIIIEASNDLKWTEGSENNTFKILSSNITMEILVQSKVNSITFGKLAAKSEADTKVVKDTLDTKKAIINNAEIIVNGGLEALVTEAVSKLDISGKSYLNQITINADAKDSELVSSISTNITSYTNATIALTLGAEDSRVEFLSKVNARVENLTDTGVRVGFLQENRFNDVVHNLITIGKMEAILITPSEDSRVNLEGSNITKLDPKATTSVTTFGMTANQSLRACGLFSIFQYGSKTLTGKLEWLFPDTIIKTSGNCPWVFIPTDEEHYNRIYGVSYVNVN